MKDLMWDKTERPQEPKSSTLEDLAGLAIVFGFPVILIILLGLATGAIG